MMPNRKLTGLVYGNKIRSNFTPDLALKTPSFLSCRTVIRKHFPRIFGAFLQGEETSFAKISHFCDGVIGRDMKKGGLAGDLLFAWQIALVLLQRSSVIFIMLNPVVYQRQHEIPCCHKRPAAFVGLEQQKISDYMQLILQIYVQQYRK